MYQVIPMTLDERKSFYMKMKKKELVNMLINLQEITAPYLEVPLIRYERYPDAPTTLGFKKCCTKD
jgi:hypothetical protein